MSIFPGNIVDLFAGFLGDMPETKAVVKRELRPTDPNGTVAVFADVWTPQDIEIGQWEPAVGRYALNIDALHKNINEEAGREEQATFAKSIRAMLYRNQDLRVALAQTSETSGSVTERAKRFAVLQQRFHSNELQGQFIFVSTTDLFVETEVS